MGRWQDFCLKHLNAGVSDISLIRKMAGSFGEYGIYADSINECKGSILFIIKENAEKKLVVFREGNTYNEFDGEEYLIGDFKAKLCPLIHQNCLLIRREFPYTAPTAVLKFQKTIGLGDRLGLATPGHIRLIKHYDVKPVFAQQSIRELNLTGRTYENVLDGVSWAVFQEDYKGGFGADGDHLKKPEEILMALNCGFTMITLDCSEHINDRVSELSEEEAEKLYLNSCKNENMELESKYAGKKFPLKNGSIIEFRPNDLKEIILTYYKAVSYAISIFNEYIKNYQREVDFEISIDETMTSTSPESHFFVASELAAAGVRVASIAPRFCGEFQKGIDYIGVVAQFEKEFKIHASIAENFGYKLSIHSGSDKFSTFPIIGEKTQGRYHLKTAGTNWLEAVRVIAMKAPGLYREMHSFALGVLDEAKKYYHIGADVRNIPDIDSLSDNRLPELMNKPDSRQVMHITYGLILLAKNPDGSPLFKERLYAVLHNFEQDYHDVIFNHIGKHLKCLGNESESINEGTIRRSNNGRS